MAASIALGDRAPAAPALGGYTALAEGSWMGHAQTTDVLEPARGRRVPGAAPRAPRRGLARLLTRELDVAGATAVLMASFLAPALLGAVRQVLFNAQFGAGPDANAYYAAFRLPDTLFSLIAGGALSSAMIPVLVGAVRDEGEEAGRRLTQLVLTTLLAVFAAVVVAGELFAPLFVTKVLAPGFDPPMQRLTVALTRIMLFQPLILAVGSVATAVLNSRSQFDAAAGALTYAVLVPYAAALPAYVATEVLVRGLIALRDTRTPLITNTIQLAGRGALMAALLGSLGVIAVPVAFATAASVETMALACILFLKMRRRHLTTPSLRTLPPSPGRGGEKAPHP